MKITYIKAKGLFEENFDMLLKFDSFKSDGNGIFCDAEHLSQLIDFLFLAKQNSIQFDGNAEVVFEQRDIIYTLTRTKNFDNTICLLRCTSGGVVRRYTNVEKKLKEIFSDNLNKLFDGLVIESSEFKSFSADPDISRFKSVSDLRRAVNSAKSSFTKATDKKSEIKSQLMNVLQTPFKIISDKTINELRAKNSELRQQYLNIVSEIDLLKDELRTLKTRESIESEMNLTQNHIDRLVENSDFIDEKRQQLSDHRKIQKVLPQLKEILIFKKQASDLQKKDAKNKEEINWLENERKAVIGQLAEIADEINRKVEQNTRLLLIKGESETINGLSGRNSELLQRIQELQSDKEKLEQLRDTHKQALDNIDKTIDDTKESLKKINVPIRSINELIENVRLSVKIKEIDTQHQQVDSDIIYVSQQINEKETNIKKASENLTSIIEMDNILTPFKSKDTILQMLQAKIQKGEMVLQSLADKQNRLREEVQDLHYKEIEIDQSTDCLQTILAQKQYDRDIIFKRQIESEQMLPELTEDNPEQLQTFSPSNCAFIDEHIESLRGDLVVRNNKKLDFVSRQVGLKYVLNEVERQRQIVLGDIVTCRNERDAIVRRFRDLSKIGNKEIVGRYFQAFEIGKATNFVLDVQRSLVEQQTELSLLKQEYDNLLKKKKDIVSRLTYLSETQTQIDAKQMTVEMMVESNEQVKSDLLDHTDKLVMCQTQRKMESDSLEALDIRLANLNGNINELMNEQKSNEKEILKIHKKISSFVKGEPSEVQQSAQAKVNELLSEKKLLEESRIEFDDKILSKSIEAEKDNVMLEALTNGYEAKKTSAQELMTELGGEDIESIKLKNLSKAEFDQVKEGIDKYETTLDMLKSRMDNLKKMYDNDEDREKADHINEQLFQKSSLSAQLRLELNTYDEQNTQLMADYIKSNRMRAELSNLVNLYYSNKDIQPIVQQSKVVEAVFEDEVKKILAHVSTTMGRLAKKTVSVSIIDGKFVCETNGISSEFSSLSQNDKLSLFLSIRLFEQSKNWPELKSVLLHGHVDCAANDMALRLSRLKDFNFIVENTINTL